jgi:DNA-binding LacI/PurR family transcriptional regulator
MRRSNLLCWEAGSILIEEMIRRQCRMQDIADRGGVSRMTVSLALRNDPRLAEKTRLRIQRLAEQMGYRPNPLVSALMTNLREGRKTGQKVRIGFVAHDRFRKVAALRPFMEGAARRAEELGYHIERFWIGRDGAGARQLSRILYTRGVSGILLSPLYEPEATLEFDWSLFAVGAIGYSMQSPGLHRAVNHHLHSMSLAVRQLHQAGYRRISLALPQSQDVRVEHNWLAGFLMQQHLFSDPPSYPAVLLAHEWNESVFSRWFLEHRPDAVISIQLEVLDWLKRLKVDVPGDTGFVHLNWEPEYGPIAGVNQRSDLVGAAALELVVNQLHCNERGVPIHPRVVLIEGEWVEGTTVAPR